MFIKFLSYFIDPMQCVPGYKSDSCSIESNNTTLILHIFAYFMVLYF
jgi:hypothetical protein